MAVIKALNKDTGEYDIIPIGGILDAPSDNRQYVRYNSDWKQLDIPIDAPADNNPYIRYNNKWSSLDNFIPLESAVSYGIQWNTDVASPVCTRIGNPDLHRSLPIQSKMRGCLLADNGVVNKYLNENDWTSEVRDGSEGQVMVEIPEHYRKCITEGTIRKVLLSEYPFPDYQHIPKSYVSAYEASLQRSTLTLFSAINYDADFRGGNNSTSYDETNHTLLGRPITNISILNSRTYAQNRNDRWNCLTYDIYKSIQWLYYVEYANFNCQLAYNAEKDSNGYTQGGLGSGVTTLSSSEWEAFNNYNPFIPCGYTDSLGNNTGIMSYNLLNEDDTILKTVSVPRYRGRYLLTSGILASTLAMDVLISAIIEVKS